jgi:acetyltransferase-like isoleucine patch superfamily enzyme
MSIKKVFGVNLLNVLFSSLLHLRLKSYFIISPIFLSWDSKISGNVIYNKYSVLLIGLNRENVNSILKGSRICVGKTGKLIVNGHNEIARGSFLSVNKNAILEICGCSLSGANRIYCYRKIVIGSGTQIAEDVWISDNDFHSVTYENNRTSTQVESIVIGDRVWIGRGAIILKGVLLGDDVIVAAHSVVAKGVYPSGSLVAGNPAKIIRSNCFMNG